MLGRHLSAAGIALALGLACATGAQAQDFKTKEAGDILVRGRGVAVLPQSSNTAITTQGGAATGLKVGDISNSFVPELDFSYFFTDMIAAELILGTTRHDVKTANGIDMGHVWLLPPTLTAQFHPFPKARFSPYVGAGINYTMFYGVKSGSNPAVQNTSYSNSFGPALQLGMDVALGGNWSFNVDVKKLWVRTDVSTNALKANDVKIDPWLVGVGIGYRF
ncbi:MAG: OmpW family protein [Alphaproteobacteria bacterium]|nr:OmpW family protein [Alphaproteobacteria bacterium]